jgi:hypothetical protein
MERQDAPLWRSRGVKHSAINAACGLHHVVRMKDSTTAKDQPRIAVFIIVK